jgi:hypothetical protein
MDKDVACIQIKINVSGRWAHRVNCEGAHYDAVKAACAALAETPPGSIRFKALDAAGGVSEPYGAIQNGVHGLGSRRPARTLPRGSR